MDATQGTRQDSTPLKIGQRVRTIRRRRGLSLDAAAGLAGITKPYLSMLENGRRRAARPRALAELNHHAGAAHRQTGSGAALSLAHQGLADHHTSDYGRRHRLPARRIGQHPQPGPP